MDRYNSLFTDFSCPHCKKTVDLEIKLSIGDVNQLEYLLGDQVRWLPEKSIENGGRPEAGNLDAEVIARCPVCGSTHKVTVEIRSDMITRIMHTYEPDQVSDLQPTNPWQISPEKKPDAIASTIKIGNKWQLTTGRESALARLSELGVEIYSLGGDDFTLMIPWGLAADQYIDIGYLIAQLGDEEFPDGYEGLTIKKRPEKIYPNRIMDHPPVFFVDGYPQGMKYRVQPFRDEKKEVDQ